MTRCIVYILPIPKAVNVDALRTELGYPAMFGMDSNGLLVKVIAQPRYEMYDGSVIESHATVESIAAIVEAHNA